MATTKKKSKAKAPRVVLIRNGVASPDPARLSFSGRKHPRALRFRTRERSRVYEVRILDGALRTAAGKSKVYVWFGHDSEVLTPVRPKASRSATVLAEAAEGARPLRYRIRVVIGEPIQTNADTPTIMVED